MAISSDYPKPITVNGFVCRNCDDVSKAKKFEDPSPPKVAKATAADSGAVSFGGALSARNGVGTLAGTQQSRQALDRYA